MCIWLQNIGSWCSAVTGGLSFGNDAWLRMKTESKNWPRHSGQRNKNIEPGAQVDRAKIDPGAQVVGSKIDIGAQVGLI